MKHKKEQELKGGFLPLLAGLLSLIPTAIDIGSQVDQAKRNERAQAQLEEYFRKRNEAIERDNRLYEEGLRRSQEAKDRSQAELSTQRQTVENRNIILARQYAEEKKRLAEEKNAKQQAENEVRMKEALSRDASERQRIAQAQQDAISQKYATQQRALEENNNVVRQEVDTLTNLRAQKEEERQRQMDEIRRLQQEAIAKELQQQQEAIPTTPQIIKPRAPPRTAIRRRGKGVDNEVMTYLTSKLGMSQKDAKKVLHAYF